MIQATFYLESQGNKREAVKRALEQLVERMRSQEGVEVRRAVYGDVISEAGVHSMTAEVEASFTDLRSYLLSALMFGPSAITVEAPASMKVGREEFLKVVGEIAAITRKALEKHGAYFTFPEPSEEVKVGLEEDEIEGLLDQGAIRAKIVVEKEGDEEEAKRRFISAIEKEVFVHKVRGKRVEDKSLIAIHAFLYEPKTLLEIAIKHNPVLIEILEPREIELPMLELQDMGVELAASYFELAHLALRRRSPS